MRRTLEFQAKDSRVPCEGLPSPMRRTPSAMRRTPQSHAKDSELLHGERNLFAAQPLTFFFDPLLTAWNSGLIIIDHAEATPES
jgi:hypothetical protein